MVRGAQHVVRCTHLPYAFHSTALRPTAGGGTIRTTDEIGIASVMRWVEVQSVSAWGMQSFMCGVGGLSSSHYDAPSPDVHALLPKVIAIRCPLPHPQHYLSTLLASRGVQTEENCEVYGITSTEWAYEGWHPHPHSYA